MFRNNKSTPAHNFKPIFKIGRELAEGSYGKTYTSFDTILSENVVLKEMKKDNHEKGIPQSAVREISICADSNNPNIVRLLRVVFNNDKVFMVFEKCDMDLRRLLDVANERSMVLPLNLVKMITRDLLKGLSYLHKRHVMHRDLKPANILVNVNSNGRGVTSKLCDFGLSRDLVGGADNTVYTGEMITIQYRSPEVLLGSSIYDEKADLWSVGCIIYELITGNMLFGTQAKEDAILENILRYLGQPSEELWKYWGKISEFRGARKIQKFAKMNRKLERKIERMLLKDLTQESADLVLKLIRYNPLERISAEVALEHPFLQNPNAFGNGRFLDASSPATTIPSFNFSTANRQKMEEIKTQNFLRQNFLKCMLDRREKEISKDQAYQKYIQPCFQLDNSDGKLDGLFLKDFDDQRIEISKEPIDSLYQFPEVVTKKEEPLKERMEDEDSPYNSSSQSQPAFVDEDEDEDDEYDSGEESDLDEYDDDDEFDDDDESDESSDEESDDEDENEYFSVGADEDEHKVESPLQQYTKDAAEKRDLVENEKKKRYPRFKVPKCPLVPLEDIERMSARQKNRVTKMLDRERREEVIDLCQKKLNPKMEDFVEKSDDSDEEDELDVVFSYREDEEFKYKSIKYPFGIVGSDIKPPAKNSNVRNFSSSRKTEKVSVNSGFFLNCSTNDVFEAKVKKVKKRIMRYRNIGGGFIRPPPRPPQRKKNEEKRPPLFEMVPRRGNGNRNATNYVLKDNTNGRKKKKKKKRKER